jgi:hypothetical protein
LRPRLGDLAVESKGLWRWLGNGAHSAELRRILRMCGGKCGGKNKAAKEDRWSRHVGKATPKKPTGLWGDILLHP